MRKEGRTARMSDIRLTSSETKMKINLCIFLLCNTAVSVFGQSVELNGTAGKSVKFPAAVKKVGKLKYGSKAIGYVLSGALISLADPEFSGRVHWDSSTGLFSLSGLRVKDSGAYAVEKDDGQKSVSTFSLTVWAVELNGVKNESIVFPTKVETSGNLNSSKLIGRIDSQELFTASEYKGRVHWDKNTGLFSLSGLRLEDSGIYTVENTDGQSSVSTFNLTVWIPVSKPNISITHNEFPCTIECTAERGTEATLSWYREGQKKPYVSSRVASAPHLHLPQTVERSGTYTCEAKNSVSRETSDPLTVGAHCTAVSVFGGPQELNGIVGKSIEFPAAVETGGSLMYGSKVIGRILGGELIPLTTPEYQGRVQWDKSTGLFSLSGLRLEDSGVYTVEKDDGQKSVSFSLTVWKDNVPASKPSVSITRNEYPCTIECTAERGTRVTLSWYREGEKKPYVSSRVASAPYLHLPETVESGTYTCEAKNSVSRETSDPLTVGAHCTAPSRPSTGKIVAISVIAAVAILIAVVFAVLYCLNNKQPLSSCGIRKRIQGIRKRIQVNKHLANVNPPPYVNNKQPLSSCDEDEQASPQDGNITSRLETGAR